MTNKLPDSTKSLVIQQWLQGSPRDTIAANNGLSTGAVTGIVNDWRRALGSTAATELRELAVALKRAGISPVQCATGLRVAAIMTRLGLKEGSSELFLSEVYSRCSEQGITPENIASYLTDLLRFSRTVPFSGMSDHIQKLTYEQVGLKQKIEELNDEKWKLIGKIDELDTRRYNALEESKITSNTLKWYSDLYAELKKQGIPIDDVLQLARVVSGIKQYGFDVQQILAEFSNLELHKARCQSYQANITRLKSQYDTLNQDYVFLQQTVSSYNQRLSKCDELEAMGFGLKELKLLWYTIREIADANNIPLHNAVARFFNDINKHYDDKLRFESEANRLRVEVNKLNQECERKYAELSLFSRSGPLLLQLIQAGVEDKEIMCLAELLKNGSTEERQILIDEVKKYGSIKSIIKKLACRESVVSLETKKQALNQDSPFKFSYSEKILSLPDRLTTSSRKATMGLLSMIAYLMHLFDVRTEILRELDDDDLGEFAPIIMAARGEPVGQPELKRSIMIAIELVMKGLPVEYELDILPNDEKNVHKPVLD